MENQMTRLNVAMRIFTSSLKNAKLDKIAMEICLAGLSGANGPNAQRSFYKRLPYLKLN